MLIEVLRGEPGTLARLLEVLGLGSLPDGLEVVDSTERLIAPVEVRPDLVLLSRTTDAWSAVEVQLKLDADKVVRWPLFMTVLTAQRGTMGDLLVITPSRRVARQARREVQLTGPLGTTVTMDPVVVHVTERHARVLLSEDHPELAFFAVWAVAHRRGRRAERIVRRALALAKRLAPERRRAQVSAILRVLGDPLLRYVQEMAMNPERVPESELLRTWREELEARGRAEGLAQALLVLLDSRRIPASSHERARIRTCRDPAQLERWLTRAATASSLEAVFQDR